MQEHPYLVATAACYGLGVVYGDRLYKHHLARSENALTIAKESEADRNTRETISKNSKITRYIAGPLTVGIIVGSLYGLYKGTSYLWSAMRGSAK